MIDPKVLWRAFFARRLFERRLDSFRLFAMTRQKRASILIELLLTVVILATSLTVIVQGVVSAHRASRMGWRYSEAAMALDNAMVEWIFKGGVPVGIHETGILGWPFSSYNYQLSSSAVRLNNVVHPRINDVEISAGWNEGSQARLISAQTFLMNTDFSASQADLE